MKLVKLIIVLVLLPSLISCQSISYYRQAAKGQWQLISQKQQIDELITSENIDDKLKAKLEYVRQVREYASKELSLPDNDSYTEYVDLGRNYAVYNVMAAPEFSLSPKKWCFLVVGCISYKGFFNKEDAVQLANALKAEGYDTATGPVSAYSTLGWFDDPILNTIINRPNYKIAGLIFHELAHQAVYVDGDTQFNESFATTIELAGLKKWLTDNGDSQSIERSVKSFKMGQEFKQLLFTTREKLVKLYKQTQLKPDELRNEKEAIFEGLRVAYQQIKETKWENYKGYDRYFNRDLNNAHLISVALYHGKVPQFQALLKELNNDVPSFILAVKALSKFDKAKRNQILKDSKSFAKDFI